MYFDENEQARLIISEISNLPHFIGALNVSPSAIIKGFKAKKDLHSFTVVTFKQKYVILMNKIT